MAYFETREAGNSFRAEYLESLNKLIEKKQAEAELNRKDFDVQLAEHTEEYRKKLAEMFGWPLTARLSEEKTVPEVRKQFVAKDGAYSIYRMQLEIMPEFWYYGILFVKEDGKKRPLVLSQHGGLGTPELISGFYEGKTGNYNDMTNRILAKDVNVFAPQMLLWNVNTYGNTYDRVILDGKLKSCGGSITAMELYCLMRCLDYFEKERYVEAGCMGMVGMSYGGMYTMYLAALDERIQSAVSCSFFGKHGNLAFADWAFQNSANTFMDAEMVMLVRPRKIYLAMGNQDSLCTAEDSLAEFERIKELFPDWQQWCDHTIFEGPHEFIKDDKFIDRMIADLKNMK